MKIKKKISFFLGGSGRGGGGGGSGWGVREDVNREVFAKIKKKIVGGGGRFRGGGGFRLGGSGWM